MNFDVPAGQSTSTEEIQSLAESLFNLHFRQWKGLLRHTRPEDILRTDISDLKPLPR